MKIGLGYDVHPFTADRPLFLGGVRIPYEKGLAGHSDADVLVHAICDALLGAAGMGDIGEHFPDDDPRYKDAFSIDLLREAWRRIRRYHPTVINIDATVFAEAPKLGPYKQAMLNSLAEALTVSTDRINIKATTSEGLGFIGEGLGIAAMCVVLID
ncbi:MAG: 2-C-methyl-D-erythritol 2,4-cyclodiphosphate synthase [Desulfobacterales bacterium]|nr:2-C-methyl-D-erythritol 2,4-cyclodiphosphate synthase [Desulfobacterales bacterium]